MIGYFMNSVFVLAGYILLGRSVFIIIESSSSPYRKSWFKRLLITKGFELKLFILIGALMVLIPLLKA